MVSFLDDFTYKASLYDKDTATWKPTYSDLSGETELGNYATWRDWSSIYQTVLKGSRAAEDAAREGALQKFLARAQGVSAGQRERVSALEGEISASGLSPEQIRRVVQEEEARVPILTSQARAETQGELQDTLGELFKGTASEIAGLQLSEKQLGHQDYLAWKARRAARKAGKRAFLSKLIGTGLTAAATYFGGPPAGAAAGSMFSAGAEGQSAFSSTPGGTPNYGYNPYLGSAYGY